MRTHVPETDVHRVRANGIDFGCLRWGDTGPLVLLVHGFPDTAHTWGVVGPRVAAAGFRVVAPFTRGIAPSSIPADGDYSSDTLGRDVLALIDALGEQKAIVVGHDFGASAVYSAGGLGADKIHKLVGVAIPHPAAIRPRLSLLWGARHFVTHRLPGAHGRFAKDDYAQIRTLYERWSPAFAWPDTEFEAARNAYSAPGSGEAAMAYYQFVSPTLPPGQRERIPVPSLVVGGLSDGVATTADFEASRRRFTGPIDVAMVPGGHFLHREHPEPFLGVLLPFLSAP